MAEPITTALIVGLAAQKFAEGAAGKSAEKLVEKLWTAIATRFAGRKKTEENLAAIEKAKGQDTGAIEKVTAVLAGEFVEDEAFEAKLKELAQQIVNIQSQSQTQKSNVQTQTIRDQGKGYQFNDIQRIDRVGDG
jgi:cytochrome c551/c552